LQTDKEQNLWAITDTGRDYLEEHKQLTESVPLPRKAPEPPPGKETGETVPSQVDLEKEGLLRRSKMAEEKPRTLKVLEALSKMTEPSSPADIGSIIEVSPCDTGETLYDLGKAGLARKPDEKQSLWLITDKGRKYIENPPVLSDRPLSPSSQADHQNRRHQNPWARSNLKLSLLKLTCSRQRVKRN